MWNNPIVWNTKLLEYIVNEFIKEVDVGWEPFNEILKNAMYLTRYNLTYMYLII